RSSRSRCRAGWMLLLMPAANRRSTFFIVALIAASNGCASHSALKLGQKAEWGRDYDRAVVEYTNALRKHPYDADARQGLERAKLRAAAEHFYKGRRLEGTGKLEDALIEYQLAAELNPTSREIDEAVNETRTQLRNKIAVSREGKTQLETLIERA